MNNLKWKRVTLNSTKEKEKEILNRILKKRKHYLHSDKIKMRCKYENAVRNLIETELSFTNELKICGKVFKESKELKKAIKKRTHAKIFKFLDLIPHQERFFSHLLEEWQIAKDSKLEFFSLDEPTLKDNPKCLPYFPQKFLDGSFIQNFDISKPFMLAFTQSYIELHRQIEENNEEALKKIQKLKRKRKVRRIFQELKQDTRTNGLDIEQYLTEHIAKRLKEYRKLIHKLIKYNENGNGNQILMDLMIEFSLFFKDLTYKSNCRYLQNQEIEVPKKILKKLPKYKNKNKKNKRKAIFVSRDDDQATIEDQPLGFILFEDVLVFVDPKKQYFSHYNLKEIDIFVAEYPHAKLFYFRHHGKQSGEYQLSTNFENDYFIHLFLSTKKKAGYKDPSKEIKTQIQEMWKDQNYKDIVIKLN